MPSRRDQIRMTPEEMEAFLASRTVGVLGTIDATGAPHLVNMSYVYRDGDIVFTSFGKAQKITNLRRNPRASFLVEVPERYDKIKGVLVRGQVTLYEGAEAALPWLREIGRANRTGGGGGMPSIDLEAIASKRAVCVLHPDRVTSWDHSRLGGVY
jgi:PPOX class probable F420-dependent enzyme